MHSRILRPELVNLRSGVCFFERGGYDRRLRARPQESSKLNSIISYTVVIRYHDNDARDIHRFSCG